MLTQLVAMAEMRELERGIEARRRRHEFGLDGSDTARNGTTGPGLYVRALHGVMQTAASGTTGPGLRVRGLHAAVQSAAARITGQPTSSERSIARARLAMIASRSGSAACCATC